MLGYLSMFQGWTQNNDATIQIHSTGACKWKSSPGIYNNYTVYILYIDEYGKIQFLLRPRKYQKLTRELQRRVPQ